MSKRRAVDGPLFGQHAHDFRDHVAGPANDDGVADADVFAANLILVVQSGVDHRHATDENRFEPCHRRQCASTADLDADVEQLGDRLLGGEFVRQRETWVVSSETEALVSRQLVQLVDHTIDIVGQRAALAADLGVVGEETGKTTNPARLGSNRKTPASQAAKQFRMRPR
jgi:hypothetical protein